VFPVLADVPAADVTKADLMAILDRARSDGRLRTANMLLAELKQMYRFALVREIVSRNPLDTVTRRDAGGPNTIRDRVLSADEVKALHAALPGTALDARSKLVLWLILGTAVRISEALGARWSHVDLEAKTWHLPETKNQRDHTVHLSEFAVRQFKALQALQGVQMGRRIPRQHDDDDDTASITDWVFPAADGRRPIEATTFAKKLAERQKPPERRFKGRTAKPATLALPGGRWTAHDLRRTAATMMAELGVSGDVIDECLNHMIESRVRRIYIRDRRLGEQALAFDALGARLQALTGEAS
jgi:integrase